MINGDLMESHQDKLKRFNINQKIAMLAINLCIFVDVLVYSKILPLLPNTIQRISFIQSKFKSTFKLSLK